MSCCILTSTGAMATGRSTQAAARAQCSSVSTASCRGAARTRTHAASRTRCAQWASTCTGRTPPGTARASAALTVPRSGLGRTTRVTWSVTRCASAAFAMRLPCARPSCTSTERTCPARTPLCACPASRGTREMAGTATCAPWGSPATGGAMWPATSSAQRVARRVECRPAPAWWTPLFTPVTCAAACEQGLEVQLVDHPLSEILRGGY